MIYFLIGIPLLLLAYMVFPASIGFAIFKYRLWDIDILIRKTLIYSLLTTALTAVYFAVILLLQSLFSSESSFILVILTFAATGLFAPLRSRIQGIIDPRFYRQKYDAEQTLAKISTKMRQQVDLEELASAILSVVAETIRPSQVGVWLKEDWLQQEPGRQPSEPFTGRAEVADSRKETGLVPI